MKSILTLTLLALSISSSAQMGGYPFNHQIDSAMNHNHNDFTGQLCAWGYANIGEHFKAIHANDTILPNGHHMGDPFKEDKSSKKEEIKAFHAVNAEEFILQQAAAHRIVIINEQHHNGNHRAFIRKLLPGLKDLGFNIYAAEAIGVRDSLLNKHKYATTSTGSYVEETEFANLIREAGKLGFTLVHYDEISDPWREKKSAENIKRILDQDANSKILIHCGYDHVAEERSDDDTVETNWTYALAGRIKLMTGLDPFTIDQVALTERGDPRIENTWRREMNYDHSVVLLDKSNKAFGKASNSWVVVDANVYHPNTKLIDGRPNWKYSQGKKGLDVRGNIKITYPCMVKAFVLNEDANAIPADATEIRNASEKKVLVLDNGKTYRVEVSNPLGNKQTFLVIN